MQKNKVDTTIANLGEILDSLFQGPCERVLGRNMFDPGAGDMCGRDGIYREDFEFILCDRCHRALCILEAR